MLQLTVFEHQASQYDVCKCFRQAAYTCKSPCIVAGLKLAGAAAHAQSSWHSQQTSGKQAAPRQNQCRFIGGPHVDDGPASRHVLHNLLRQADHADDVDSKSVLQAVSRDLREVLNSLPLHAWTHAISTSSTLAMYAAELLAGVCHVECMPLFAPKSSADLRAGSPHLHAGTLSYRM